MFSSIFQILILLTWPLLVSAIPVMPGQGIIPLPPSKDSFYVPPPGYEASTPGTILRTRPPPAPLGAFSFLALQPKAAFQVLYRTNDAIGNPQAAVTTIIIPRNANMSRVVSYHDFPDASSPDCATSYALQIGSSLNTTQSKAVTVLQSGMLAKGWVVAMPDYEGPKAAAFSGMQAGHAALDGIRAALASTPITGINPRAEVAMWGYSGGSIPTEWAAELQPTYAPELVIKAAVVGGSITNLQNTLTTINKSVFAGFGLAGLFGLIKSYPNVTEFFSSQIIPEKKALVDTAATSCALNDLYNFADKDIGSFLRDGLGALQTPLVQSVFQAAGVMGLRGLPNTPMYFHKAISDDISPIADNDQLVNKYCSMGIGSLVYRRNSFGEHVTESMLGLGGSLGFLNDRFTGVPLQKGCQISNVTIVTLDLSTLSGFGAEEMAIMQQLMGTAVAPSMPKMGLF